MRVVISVLLSALIGACANPNPLLLTDQPVAFYEEAFRQVDHLLQQDGARFWGHPLSGPILIADPATHKCVASERVNGGSFRSVGKVFVGSLPHDLNISNTAINWNGKRWTMVRAPLPTNQQDRNHLIIHELFHRIQPDIGFDSLKESDNRHLDTYEGRLLLRLELEALRQALSAATDLAYEDHLTNALRFRSVRQSEPAKKQAENTLEINEGLAEYTGMMLSGRSNQELRDYLLQGIHQFNENPTFVRSFAYLTIPIYGYLLAQREPSWHRKVDRNTNLTDYLLTAFSVEGPEEMNYPSWATAYNYQVLATAEQQREEKRQRVLATYREKFLQDTVLQLPFLRMHISFDPATLIPLEEYGTVYPNLRVTDDWGILTVEEGALVRADWTGARVSKPLQYTSNTVAGKGWKLALNAGWKITQVGDGYVLRPEK